MGHRETEARQREKVERQLFFFLIRPVKSSRKQFQNAREKLEVPMELATLLQAEDVGKLVPARKIVANPTKSENQRMHAS